MALTDDQRAMIRLLAQREEGYEDIAALMGLSVEEVRTRVKEALEELGEEPDKEPPQPPSPSPPPKPTPPSPAPKPSQSPPRLSLPNDRGKRAAILAGAGVVVLLIVLLVTGVLGGDDSSSSSTTTTAAEGDATSAAETTGAENGKLTQAILSPVNGGGGEGRALFGRVKKNIVLQVEAQGLDSAPKGQAYVVWLAGSSKAMVPLTPIEVDKSGRIRVQYPLPTEVLSYLAAGVFDEIDISLVSVSKYEAALTKAKKKKQSPAYTGTDILRGRITGPIVGAAKKNQG